MRTGIEWGQVRPRRSFSFWPSHIKNCNTFTSILHLIMFIYLTKILSSIFWSLLIFDQLCSLSKCPRLSNCKHPVCETGFLLTHCYDIIKVTLSDFKSHCRTAAVFTCWWQVSLFWCVVHREFIQIVSLSENKINIEKTSKVIFIFIGQYHKSVRKKYNLVLLLAWGQK